MTTIAPVYNHGRWLVYCPKHGKDGAMPAGGEYICPVCYPGIVARFTAVKNGKLQTIEDRSARRTARLMAEADNKIYMVSFPKAQKSIEKELEKLPEHKRNWNGEPMTQLKAHVKKTKHIIDNFEKRDKSKDGNNPAVVIIKGGE